jgi:hypothetical protein
MCCIFATVRYIIEFVLIGRIMQRSHGVGLGTAGSKAFLNVPTINIKLISALTRDNYSLVGYFQNVSLPTFEMQRRFILP